MASQVGEPLRRRAQDFLRDLCAERDDGHRPGKRPAKHQGERDGQAGHAEQQPVLGDGLGAERAGEPDLGLEGERQRRGHHEVDRLDPRPDRRTHDRTVLPVGDARLRPEGETNQRAGG